MSLSFVLVEPTRAANVGAAARAINTMGFDKLILINSKLNQQQEAHWLAHGSTHILENTKHFDNFTQLREHFDLLIATTARERSGSRTFLSPEKLMPIVGKHSNQQQIAIVFGRESSGLTNDELALCDLYSYIPLSKPYPSINLAQAVMIYSYALSSVKNNIGLTSHVAVAPQLQALKSKGQQLLSLLQVKEADKLNTWLMDHLSQLDERDCKMAHQLLNDILRKI